MMYIVYQVVLTAILPTQQIQVQCKSGPKCLTQKKLKGRMHGQIAATTWLRQERSRIKLLRYTFNDRIHFEILFIDG